MRKTKVRGLPYFAYDAAGGGVAGTANLKAGCRGRWTVVRRTDRSKALDQLAKIITNGLTLIRIHAAVESLGTVL